jgi:hypothetical protein
VDRARILAGIATTSRRSGTDPDLERDVLARIRCLTRSRREKSDPIGPHDLHVFGILRRLIDQGDDGVIDQPPDMTPQLHPVISSVTADLAPFVLLGVHQWIPRRDDVPRSVRQQVAQHTKGMTSRQIAWVQATELLRDQPLTWARIAPTRVERAKLESLWKSGHYRRYYELQRQMIDGQADPETVRQSLDRVTAQMPSAGMAPVSADDVQDRLAAIGIKANARRSKYLARAFNRLRGRPRGFSLDAEVGILLGMTRQAAHYLRRQVEQARQM